MNICILISSLNYGGSSQIAVDLACGLKDKGNFVTVITLWDTNDNKYVEKLVSKTIEIKTCNKKGKFDFLCYKRLRKMLKEGNYDVVNTHLTSLFYCFLAKPSQNVVHTIHSVPALDIPRIYRALMKRWIHRHNVFFISCSNDIYDKAVLCYKGQRIELIINGFNPPACNFTKTPIKDFDFIYAGRLVSMKNINELITAFSLINKNHDKKLCIVGDGPERNKLEKMCLDNGVANVHFTGNIDNVFDYLYKSKIFCLFSDFEGGPICLLEAMNCGLPIVCSNIGGNKTYASNGKNALFFKLHDIDEAKNMMAKLLEDKKLYDKMSFEAYKTAKENCVENMVDKYEALFLRLRNGQN